MISHAKNPTEEYPVDGPLVLFAVGFFVGQLAKKLSRCGTPLCRSSGMCLLWLVARS